MRYQNNPQPSELRVNGSNGRLVVPVPWNSADEVQIYLRNHGFASTLHLDARARAARLELWGKPDANAVQALLAGCHPAS